MFVDAELAVLILRADLLPKVRKPQILNPTTLYFRPGTLNPNPKP